MKRIIKNIFSMWPFCSYLCWHGRRSSQNVALTFDDGPSVVYTKKILDLLRQEGVVATFFLEGRWVEENSNLVSEIADAGHLVGNHGFDHGDGGVVSQLSKGEDALVSVGISTHFFRPVLGKLRLKEAVWLFVKGYRTVLWSFDTHDSMRHEGKWLEGEPDYSCIQGGDIILMHDDNPICLAELPRLIKEVKQRQLGFVSVVDINRR